jgi:hypothetical protein
MFYTITRIARFEEVVVETLFHYTTATGLLGILKNGNLWASDLRFLNDAQESVYARDMVIGAIEKMENPVQRSDHWAQKHGQAAIDTFANYHGFVLDEVRSSEFGVYVTCFCESGDLLSQWRGYGQDHGYAIEIAKDSLRDAAKAMPAYPSATGLFKVQYGLDAANEVVENTIQIVADFNLNHPGVKAHYSALAVNSMLAQVKHPGFAEEREWRLVIGLELFDESTFDSGGPPTQFRSTPIAIVPYLEIPVKRESIISVCVGPGDNAEIRASGVRRLLKILGSEAVVTHSEVPLRS